MAIVKWGVIPTIYDSTQKRVKSAVIQVEDIAEGEIMLDTERKSLFFKDGNGEIQWIKAESSYRLGNTNLQTGAEEDLDPNNFKNNIFYLYTDVDLDNRNTNLSANDKYNKDIAVIKKAYTNNTHNIKNATLGDIAIIYETLDGTANSTVYSTSTYIRSDKKNGIKPTDNTDGTADGREWLPIGGGIKVKTVDCLLEKKLNVVGVDIGGFNTKDKPLQTIAQGTSMYDILKKILQNIILGDVVNKPYYSNLTVEYRFAKSFRKDTLSSDGVVSSTTKSLNTYYNLGDNFNVEYNTPINNTRISGVKYMSGAYTFLENGSKNSVPIQNAKCALVNTSVGIRRNGANVKTILVGMTSLNADGIATSNVTLANNDTFNVTGDCRVYLNGLYSAGTIPYNNAAEHNANNTNQLPAGYAHLGNGNNTTSNNHYTGNSKGILSAYYKYFIQCRTEADTKPIKNLSVADLNNIIRFEGANNLSYHSSTNYSAGTKFIFKVPKGTKQILFAFKTNSSHNPKIFNKQMNSYVTNLFTVSNKNIFIFNSTSTTVQYTFYEYIPDIPFSQDTLFEFTL